MENEHACRSAVGVAHDERRFGRTELFEPGLLATLACGEVPESRSFCQPENALERLKECTFWNSRQSILRRSDVDLARLRFSGEEGGLDIERSKFPTALCCFGAQQMEGNLRSRRGVGAETAVLGHLAGVDVDISRKDNAALRHQGRRVFGFIGAYISCRTCKHAVGGDLGGFFGSYHSYSTGS